LETDRYFPLNLPPGVAKNGTKYQTRGRWFDAHLVRWSEGILRPIGGWVSLKNAAGAELQATGTPRTAHAWRANDGGSWYAVGTVGAGVTRAYALSGFVLTDITLAGTASGARDGTYISAGNYGQGPYGFGLYGQGGAIGQLSPPDVWSFDNFGEILVGTLTADGRALSWDKNPANDFVAISGAPTLNRALVVTPERFLFVMGGTDCPACLGYTGLPDRRRIVWPDQETLTTWVPSGANQAGRFTLQTKGQIIAGRRTNQQTLIWTDADLHIATYIGVPFVYSFSQVGDNCGLIGPNAVAIAGNVAYWMSQKKFFLYDGVVRPIPSEVSDYIFADLALAQRNKITAWPVPEFNEIWWFYPSGSSPDLENDRYVAYNYVEKHWSIGRLARNAGVPSGVLSSPVLNTSDGKFYQHETAEDRGTEVPYVESGPIEMGDGEQFLDVQTIIPDEKTLGDTFATFFVSNFPTEVETTYGPFSLANPTSVRFQARQIRVRFSQNVETAWRVGVPRLGFVPGDRR
jgi:hypothetical protein